LINYAQQQVKRASANEITDLEAMALIVDYSAVLFDGNYEEMIPALNQVFCGTTTTAPWGIAGAQFADKCAAVGRPDCKQNTYTFGDSGFKEEFQDTGNQIFHFWAYVAQTASTSNNTDGLMGDTLGGYGIGWLVNL
jgi:hypothetical protein